MGGSEVTTKEPLFRAYRPDGSEIEASALCLNGDVYSNRCGIVRSPRLAFDKSCSDGHHSFRELYEHRYWLWLALLCTCCRLGVWRSKLHHDGTMFQDSFVLGVGFSEHQLTYHLPMRLWDAAAFAETLECAPVYNGHTPDDVLRELRAYVERVTREEERAR